MGFDGFLVPDWAKPYVGWAVGMDWPEGDESRCFRLADACAATARSVAGEGPLSSQGSMGAAGGVKWDGEALKLFAEHVKKVSGGKQAELVDRLVSAALELNQAGVQVEYTKKMIEVSVWFLIFQIGWLLAASAGPWGALSLALIGPRVQLARMTIQQIAHRLLINLALFGGLGVVMDAGVQLSQSRRDGIDWESVKASGMMGALSGVFLTALPAGLSGLSTAGLRAGLSRAEMTAFEKFLAASTSSMWGMMAQSGLANGAATAVSLAMSGQFDWEMVLKGTTAGVIGGADAHWAGQPTVRGAGGGGGGPAHGGDGGGPPGGTAGGSPPGGTVPHDPGGPSGPGGTVPHDPGGPSGSGGKVPHDPGGPSGPGVAGDLGAVGAHQAGSGRPADPVAASGGTGHAPADSATVLAQAVPPVALGPDGTASPHTVSQAAPSAGLGPDGTAPPHITSHTAPPAVPPVALRPDGTAPPHAAPPAPPAAAAAPAFAAKPGGGPAGRVENAGPVSAVTPGEGGSPAHPATGTGRPGQAHVAADDAAGPGPGGAAHPGTGTAAHPGSGGAAHPGSGTAAHPGSGGAAHPGSGTAAHPGSGGAAHPGPEAAVPTVPAPRDPVATGESAPAARLEAGSIDSLINHGDGQGTATVLTGQQSPDAPQPFPAADPEAVRPPRPITLRDHESFAQSVATGITGPREPLRTGAESLRADRVTLGDGTRAVDKELAGRDARDREYLTSRLGQAVGADVAAVHIAGERRVLVDWVGGERAEVRLNPDGSWEAPGHHGTADGILLGLLDTLTSHYDRFRFPDADLDLRAADIDLRVGENGALRAFDHEKAFQGILPDTRNPFVRHFFRETSPMRVEWAGNPLSRSDIEVLRARIDALEGEFRALGRDDWYANAKFAFDRIAEHAEGTTPLLDAAREPTGPGRVPSRADGPDALPGSEEPASSGGAGDRTPSEGEARDGGSGTRDAAPADEVRGVTSRDGAPSPDEVAARLMDPGGELGRSAASGVRHSRLLDAGDVRAEIVTFGDGRTAMRLTGREAEAAEAAALTRAALGLDGPAVHRSGDVVYREYGDDALRRSIETGIRETRLIPDGNTFRELVTFNDGRQAFRIERRSIDGADAIERAALPPLSTADASGGIHRASETVVYETRVKVADDPEVKPLVWREPPGHEAKRGLYDVLTLGETFNMHTMETNAHGEPSLRIERDLADTWDKALLDGFLDEGVVSQRGAVDFRFRRNGLTGEDVAAVAARLEALRPEFERRGWQSWYGDMAERFEYLGRQAQGDQPLLTGPDAVPHGPVLPETVPHDGAASPVARSADAEWPYDPATTRPDEALAQVLREGDLGRLNEALADPAAHPGDAARARAYAELVDEGLAELPRSRGTVQARVPVDRLPEGLAAGQEFTARGFLEGVDDPRFLPDMDRSARLVVYGEHTRVGDLSGRPHQVVFEGNSRFKVLGVHETSYGVKEYFVARVSDVEAVLPDARAGELPKAPPELPPWLQRHFDEHREVTDAGVWYRDLNDPADLDLAESARAVRGMDGLFYVDAHGDSDGIYIGEDGLSARELAMLLLNEPGLRPDDVIYLGNCEVGQRAFAQELARETGHVVIAADSIMSVNQFGDMNPVTDGKARTTMAGRGRLLVFLPDVPVPPVAWERVQSGLTGPPFLFDGPGAYVGPQSGIRAAESATRAESMARAESATSAEFTTRAEPVPRAESVPRAEPATRVESVGRAEPSRPASSDVPPPARTEPSSGRPDPVDTARPVRDAGEDATPSGEARDRASEGEMRNRASADEARDAASADEADDAPFRSGAPSPDEVAARLMDPGGKLGESVASGVRHVRLLDAGGAWAEIVTFGDGRTAMRLTGREAEAAEAAALTRAALGLDGPAVHRSDGVVYREYGDDALRRSIETGIRETRLIPVGDDFRELVTFNDGRRAFRVDHGTVAAADAAEAMVLPPRSAAEVSGGLHRADETVVYQTRVRTSDAPIVTGDPEVKPLVWREPPGHAAKRGLYDVLTLGESFTAHVMDTNAHGEIVLGIERGFADMWDKALLDDFVVWDYSQSNIEYFRFRINDLAGEDVAAVAARLEALRPEFERRGWQRWHDGMMERLEDLGLNAWGQEPLMSGPDAVPHGPVAPDAAPHDGTAVPAARSAEEAWPHDVAGVRPDEALAQVLREGDLGRLNEVLADPVAHPGDAARARAYAELVGAGLAELPRERGTVQARVPLDRLPEGLAAGQEFTARGFLEGVDDPRFLPDMDRSARLVVYGEHTRVGDLSGRPHQVVFEEGARFKVLGVHETSYGVKEYFVARVSDVEAVLPDARTGGLPKAPPELTERLQRFFDENREVTDAGVWYRDLSDPADLDLAESARAVREMDGLFYVDAHGSPDGFYIGSHKLTARELAMLLLNEPGLRPDDVIYLGNCKVGQRSFAQEVARETGHVVIATDATMTVSHRGDMAPVIGGKPLDTMTGRGRLLIFLPDAPAPVPLSTWQRIRSWITGPPFLSHGSGEHGGPQPGARTAEPAGRVDLARSTPSDTTPPARTEPSSGRSGSASAVPRARDAVPAGEDVPPSGGARDRASAGEARDGTSSEGEARDRGPGARDAVPAGEARDGTSAGEGAVPPGGPRTPDEVAARLMDPGGELGRSAASGVRHSRLLDAGDVRAEIVTFGDGRTAMRLTGREAEAAEAAALTRVALGLDGPAVHRSGDVVYREYGDDALRRSIETGIRKTEMIRTGPGRSLELVTFNDGVQARRVDCGSIAKADRVEAGVLPPRTVADPNGGVHRASETVIYRSHLSRTDVAELRPLVREESHGHAAKRGLYDVLTLGETFNPHRTGTNASGEHLIGVDRGFAGRWGKPALDDLLRRPTSAGPGDFVFRHNGLYWTDVVAVHARLEELRPEFERRGWGAWHDGMVERLELLGRHAGGGEALLTGPDAVPHGPVLPDTVPHDGAGASAARDGVAAPAAAVRPADAGWPRDPADMRPRQALVELLWEGDLRRLNEVLADPAAHPDDVARARAYAELVGEALVELPRNQGTVQVRVPVDRLPEGLAAGREFTARGILEGVDDPRFLPDVPHSARLIIHGDHTRVADLSGRPGHVMIEGDARFKVLGVHETSYGVKEYFVTRVTESTEGGTAVPDRDVRPKERPELPDRLKRHITTNREVTDAGVWYRTPEEVLKTDFAASVRAVRKMDGVFYVDGHGGPRGLSIGGERISARDLAIMLLNEPGLRPDDVIYLGNCEVGAERYAQEVADRTGHVVVAADTLMTVDHLSGDMAPLRRDHKPGTMTGRGRLLIFLPEGPVPPAAWERVRSMAEAPPLSPDGPGGPGGLDGTRPGPGGEHGGPLSRSADEHDAPRHRPDDTRETPGADSSDAPGRSRVPDEPAPGTPNPPHSPDAPAVPVRDDGLAASVAGGVRETRVVERGGTRVEIVAFEDGRQAIRLTGRDADAAEMAALVREAMGMDGPATHRAGDVVYRDYGNEALRRSLATGIRSSELFENAQGRMEELVTFNDGRQAVRTEYIRAADADGHELTGLPPRFTGAADSGILRAGETVVYSERRVSPGDPRPEGAAWHESPAERTRRGLYTVLTTGDGFARHEVTVDAHGVHHLRVGEELPARWGGPAIREFLVAHRSPEGEPSRVTFRQNRLSPEDAAAVAARLEALRPEFARRGRLDWHDGLMDRLGHLARHADGERPVLDGLDGRTGTGADGGTGGHAPEAGDWRSRDPRAALSELLTHGDLPEVHDALAGRTGDPGDAARAGAYLDLANAELAGLPHRTGQVEVRIPADRLPGDLAPGREVAFRGLLEGVDDPRFLADAPGSVRLTIRGSYANVGDISGKPHHAMFDANARFKVLAVQESSAGAKNYFLAQVGEAADAPAAHAGGVPRPELTGEALRHFTEHREETRAGVWYRDPDSPHDMANAAASRGALPVDGALPVFAHGGPEGVYIGGRLLSAEEFAALLLNEPRLRADDVLLLADCEVGHATSSFAQEVADRTGRVVLAPDAFYGVTKYGDGFVGSIQEAPHSLLGRGRLRIFLPEGPVPLTTWEKVQAWVGSGRPAHPGSPGHDRVPAALPDGHEPGTATRGLPREAPGPGRDVPGPGREVSGDDIAYFGHDATGPEHEAPASGPETGARVPDVPAAHHAGEHGEPVSYTRDMEAFDRVYDDAATRFAEGEPADAIVPYMTENATDGVGAPGGGRGFGVELEFALPRIPWKDWRPVVESIARELHEAGLAEDPVVYDYHDSGKGYDRGWRLELEADDGIAGEIISPILHDDPASWRDLERVAEIIRSHGGEATALTGGHVHVGIPDYGTSVAKHVRLLKIYHAFEDVLFRIAQNPVDELGMHRGYDNCLPNTDTGNYRAEFEEVRLYNTGVSAVSMSDARGLPSDHLEFRMWDGHVDPGIIQTRIKLSLALAELASRELGDIPPPERLGHHEERLRSGERISREEETASFRALADLAFSRTADKEQLTALFALNRWQPTLKRYMELMED